VTTLPDIIAGPDTTLYEILPLEEEDAEMKKEEFAYVGLGIGAKVRAGVAGSTMKLAVATCGVSPVLAAWVALRLTVTVPVSVTMLPEIVAGPDVTV
jgi:sulfopyruvate decarboxylase TPP-binding subunit